MTGLAAADSAVRLLVALQGRMENGYAYTHEIFWTIERVCYSYETIYSQSTIL